MPLSFAPEIVGAVLAHMNGDHPDDNLLIARAFGDPDAETAMMTDLNGDEGVWIFTVGGDQRLLEVPWPNGPISERPGIRREVVVLYERACERLGVAPRPH
ncbi:DUF2470 domain-containing protein [Galbitalea sp. SE-J8]|uniref:DUF2470 domain-containing protein n=1 Tax=Galbitalea sp. SE-J8 TaxID=3054952 RepID=UPI00259CC1B9|nr:DUF2470 domain-containing protein [Galbitalea sp. SE-J8]MDM4762299.1 DUF2470 domain-containing protein [Galbitalea sp. SE-J8]